MNPRQETYTGEYAVLPITKRCGFLWLKKRTEAVAFVEVEYLHCYHMGVVECDWVRGWRKATPFETLEFVQRNKGRR